MSRYWSAVVHGLTPYVPGEQPKLADLVKLNTNENPYGPSPRAIEAIRAAVDDGLRLYPDPQATALCQAVADFHGLETNQVFVGNGSDEVLAHAFLALLKHGEPVLFPDISYSFYPVYARLYDIAYQEIPLTAEFEIRVDDYLRPNGGIIFPNPNAPTGRLLALSEIERLLQANRDSVLVVDEAYIDFGGASAVPLISRYQNLLVIHTFSKSRALAGLRIGYALGHPELIAGLVRVKDSFNSYPLDRLALAGGAAAMGDRAWLEDTCKKIVANRESLVAGLQSCGFEVLPSAANFVFARHSNVRGETLAAQLRDRRIIVRHFRTPERIVDFLRITVGTEEQCMTLLAALDDILAPGRMLG